MAVTILEKQAIREKVHPISVALYHNLYCNGEIAESVELLEGVIVEKMPKSPLHSSLLGKLCRFLRSALPENLDLRQEQPLTFARSELEPDIAIVAGREDEYSLKHPATASFIIEIAVSSLAYDREKANIYSLAGIPEYWIIDADRQIVEVYTEAGNEGYGQVQEFSFTAPIVLPLGGSIQISLL